MQNQGPARLRFRTASMPRRPDSQAPPPPPPRSSSAPSQPSHPAALAATPPTLPPPPLAPPPPPQQATPLPPEEPTPLQPIIMQAPPTSSPAENRNETRPPEAIIRPVIPTPSSLPTKNLMNPEPETEHAARVERANKGNMYNGRQVAQNTVGNGIRRSRSSSSSNEGNLSPKINGDRRPTMIDAWTSKDQLGAHGEEEEEGTGGWSTIILAGENMGAYMELQPPPLHRHRHAIPRKAAATEEAVAASEAATAGKARLTTSGAVANSNVQSINNSMVIGSSCEHGSPGVHIKLHVRRHQHSSNNIHEADQHA